MFKRYKIASRLYKLQVKAQGVFKEVKGIQFLLDKRRVSRNLKDVATELEDSKQLLMSFRVYVAVAS